MAVQRPEDRILTPANIVTIARIVLVPFFFALCLYSWSTNNLTPLVDDIVEPLFCALVFVVLSVTDCLDGYLARSRNEVTNFGKFIDPLADKILVIAAFLAFTEAGLMPAWVSLIVLFREFLVSGLRMFAASKGEVIAASWYGKAKTVTQMVAIILFLLMPMFMNLLPQFRMQIVYFSWFVLIVSLVLTILSMIDYFKNGWFVFKSTPDDPSLCFEIVQQESTDCALPTQDEIAGLCDDVLAQLRTSGSKLGTGESLTGGMIASCFTAIAGSSDVFKGAIVSYDSAVKESVLNVSKNRIAEVGAVDSCVASQMALGVKESLKTNASIAVTGIAGPGGEEPEKPVGTVWIAVSFNDKSSVACYCFSGSREEVRLKTTYTAIKDLAALI